MMANNLQRLLVKYYTRKGGQVLFKNKYTLNKLALEMWDEKADKGVEPSTLSRVINGKRLFTHEQLRKFCNVLNIKGKERKDLIKALQTDYLERSDLTIPIEEYAPSTQLSESFQLRNSVRQAGLFILIGFYIVFFFWWLFLFIYKTRGPLNNGYGTMYVLIPFLGGIVGLLKFKKFDILQYNLKLAVLCFSLGLLTWTGGTVIWGYYKFALNIIVAYPSWADISYVISWPFWLLGFYYLSKTANKKISFKSKIKKFVVLGLTSGGILFSYFLLIIVARKGVWVSEGGIIKTLLDFYYPLFDILIIITILLLWNLSFRRSNFAKIFPIILLLIGFIFNFIGDLSLNFATSVGSYQQGGWIDFILTTAMFALSLGVNMLDIDTV